MSAGELLIVFGGTDYTVRILKMRHGEWKSTVLEGHKGLISCVSLRADEMQVLSGSRDRPVQVWQMRSEG